MNNIKFEKLRGISLLLVEDNPADRVLLEDSLRSAAAVGGYPDGVKIIAVAKTVAEADKFLAASIKCDCVLLDMYLPDSEALEGLKFLVEKYPHMPFIIYSGVWDEDLVIESIMIGAQDFIVKQYSGPERIVQRIAIAIYKQRDVYAVKQKLRSLDDRQQA